MGTMTYSEQLLHPLWQRKRLEVFESAGWKCERCGETEVTLHAHHTQYRRGRMAWEYDDGEIVCLCANCHAAAHGKATPPADSKSAKRTVWELIAGFHLQATAEAADSPGSTPEHVERRARELCEASGYEYEHLLSLLLE